MYTIRKQFSFSAAHQLVGLAQGHPCMNLHGHNYEVELIMSSSALDVHGMVLDYNNMKPFQDFIDTFLDHKNLNEVIIGQTTAENIAMRLYVEAQALWPDFALTVRVSETPKTWAEVSHE